MKTNLDIWKENLTPEVFAKKLSRGCMTCPLDHNGCYEDQEDPELSCEETLLRWARQPAAEEAQ